MLKLLLVLVVACATAEVFWWIVGAIAVIGGACYVGWRIHRARTNARAVAARADEQQAWAIAGDERGTYGIYPPAGAEKPAKPAPQARTDQRIEAGPVTIHIEVT